MTCLSLCMLTGELELPVAGMKWAAAAGCLLCWYVLVL
jgi:hypothetical protein